jgi:hypothetical protein
MALGERDGKVDMFRTPSARMLAGALAASLLAALACSKGGGGAPAPAGDAAPSPGNDAVGKIIERLRDPAQREPALGELEDLLAQLGSSADPAIRHDSFASLAERTTSTLIDAFAEPRSSALVRARLVGALARLAPYVVDARTRTALLDRIFLPTLQVRFAQGLAPAEADAALSGMLALVVPETGPAADGPTVSRAMEALHAAALELLGRDPAAPATAAGLPEVEPDALLASCVAATRRLMEAPQSHGALPSGLRLLAAALRAEGPQTVRPETRTAAARTLGELAPQLAAAPADDATAALVETLFAPPAEPPPAGPSARIAREALLRLAEQDAALQGVVVQELLRALAAAADDARLERVPAWKALGVNARLASIPPELVLDRATAMLADVLPRDVDAPAADLPSAVGAAFDLLRGEVVRATGVIARLAGGEAVPDAARELDWAMAAARTIADIDFAGPDGQNVDLLAGLVRAAATGLSDPPRLRALFDALVRFGRPTPKALAMLLDLLDRPALDGEREDAAVRAERWTDPDPDAARIRGLAYRALFALLRRDAPGTAGPEAWLAAARFRLEQVEPLLALQKADPDKPAFQLWPPVFDPAWTEPAAAVAGNDAPAPPQPLDFALYADPLAACALPPHEAAGDVATWEAMTDADRVRYCRRWTAPFGAEPAARVRGPAPGKMQLADERCWEPMIRRYGLEAQYCTDKLARRPPAADLELSSAQCLKVVEREETYGYCFGLPLRPDALEAGQPTLWGCYERFPWLRGREPVGPSCRHLAPRLLAAWMFVQLRAAAGTPPADEVTPEKLAAILPLAALLRGLGDYGTHPDPAFVTRLDSLTHLLAGVQLDFPVFQPPRTAADRTVLDAPPPAAEADDEAGYVALPWHRRDGFVERSPTTFAELRSDFLDVCGAHDTSPDARCAGDGGDLGDELRLTAADGGPGPLGRQAASLLVALQDEELPSRLDEARIAEEVDALCFAEGAYAATCLRDAALDATADSLRRTRALQLLLAPPVADPQTAEEALRALARDADPALRPLVTEGLRRLRLSLGDGAGGAEGTGP